MTSSSGSSKERPKTSTIRVIEVEEVVERQQVVDADRA